MRGVSAGLVSREPRAHRRVAGGGDRVALAAARAGVGLADEAGAFELGQFRIDLAVAGRPNVGQADVEVAGQLVPRPLAGGQQPEQQVAQDADFH